MSQRARPSARELDRVADWAQDAFWRYVRDEEPPDELWDAVCMAMGKLSDTVRDRRRNRPRTTVGAVAGELTPRGRA